MTNSDGSDASYSDETRPYQASPNPSSGIPPAPPFPTSQPRDETRAPDMNLIVASAWLVCSVIVGLWLMISSHAVAGHDVKVGSIPETSSQAYGGDAYTGIQNAAANTAEGVKVLAEFDNTNARVERRMSSRANIGIGFIVISIGVVNFNMALRRRPVSPSDS